MPSGLVPICFVRAKIVGLFVNPAASLVPGFARAAFSHFGSFATLIWP
jgi:hypothetical protein